MIEYIKINGFKSIKQMELELRPINVLVAGNGDGKSNFISFFKMMNAVSTQNLQSFVTEEGADNLLHFGRKHTEALSAELTFSDRKQEQNNVYNLRLVQNNIGGLFIESEACGFRMTRDDTPNYLYEHNLQESHFAVAKEKCYEPLQRYMSSMQTFHFHDTSSTSWLRRGCDLNDHLFLKPDGRNLPAILYFLKHNHPKCFRRIQAVTQFLMLHFNEMILEPITLPDGQKTIELRWTDKGDPGSSFSAYQLSDGTLRFIALATLLLQESPPPIIIIDEPELGIHPISLHLLAAMIRSAANNDSQVIVATQSGRLINHFVPEDLVFVERNWSGKHTVFGRPAPGSLDHWLEDDSLGDLWELNTFGGMTTSWRDS
jgi:predicted ATPase